MIKDLINSIYRISDNSYGEIDKLFEYRCYEAGETFVNKNQFNDKEYFLLNGICKSFLINPGGDEITLSFFGEKTVLSPHTIRTKNQLSLICVKSLTKAEAVTLDANKFAELMVSNIEIRNFGNQVLRNELADKMEKEIGMASLTAKERLLNFRKKYPSLENVIPHTDIATYLGITNVSLSRLRKEAAR
ncbi:MAG: Crp/Fnr family transcriptional regulator [Ignavibacteriaceae bacterium]|nr:Crp/Fnr family transcriptional regulator [Ignavibacteriaceae bacterium]